MKTNSKSGRIGGGSIVQTVSIGVNDSFEIEEIVRKKKAKPEIPEQTDQSTDPDKLLQTTFKLGLRVSEKEAKSQVGLIILPFIGTQ